MKSYAFVRFEVAPSCTWYASSEWAQEGTNQLCCLESSEHLTLVQTVSLQTEKWIRESGPKRPCEGFSQASQLSIHYPASPAADVPVRMRTHAHQFQATKWFCLTSLYSTFDWVLCLSRSFDFWTKRFAPYASKLIVRSMVSLVLWCRGEPSQCISVLSVFGVFHNGYY